MIGDVGLRVFTTLVAAGDPNPVPSGAPTAAPVNLDPNAVGQGPWGAVAFTALVIFAVILYFSLRKQLRRVTFDEDKVNAELAAEAEAKKARHPHEA